MNTLTAFLPQSYIGLEDKEFNNTLDLFLTTGRMSSEKYEEMSDQQKHVIQTLKKAFKRLNKNND